MNGNKWRRKPAQNKATEKPATFGEELQPGRPQCLERPELEQLHPPWKQIIRASKG